MPIVENSPRTNVVFLAAGRVEASCRTPEARAILEPNQAAIAAVFYSPCEKNDAAT